MFRRARRWPLPSKSDLSSARCADTNRSVQSLYRGLIRNESRSAIAQEFDKRSQVRHRLQDNVRWNRGQVCPIWLSRDAC